MRGPCACPRGRATIMPHGTQTNHTATRTSTRPPPFPTSAPCPYRFLTTTGSVILSAAKDLTGRVPRSFAALRMTLPVVIGKVHQDGGDAYYRIRSSNFNRTKAASRVIFYTSPYTTSPPTIVACTPFSGIFSCGTFKISSRKTTASPNFPIVNDPLLSSSPPA